MGQGQSIALRGSQQTYISASSDGRVRADRYDYDDASFEIHFVNATTVAFRSSHGKWLCVEPSGYIVCDRDYRGSWEAFTLIPALFGKFAFKTCHGGHISVQSDGYITTKPYIRDCEVFDVEISDLEDGSVSILGNHGKYVTADPDGRVFVSREKQNKSETFERVVVNANQVAFKTAHGKWLGVEQDGRMCVQEKRGKSEIFYIHPAPNNKYSIRSCHNKFLSAEPEGRLVAIRDLPLDWESFAINSI